MNKPYTENWWEDLRFQAAQKEFRAKCWAHDTTQKRYNNLKTWIKNRIDNEPKKTPH